MVARISTHATCCEFSTPYYAEGEYLHEFKEYAHKTSCRLHEGSVRGWYLPNRARS